MIGELCEVLMTISFDKPTKTHHRRCAGQNGRNVGHTSAYLHSTEYDEGRISYVVLRSMKEIVEICLTTLNCFSLFTVVTHELRTTVQTWPLAGHRSRSPP
jgi:hypothetical protein